MSFFEFETQHRLKRIAAKNPILQINTLIDWQPIAQLLKGIYKNEAPEVAGCKPYEPLKMFKALLLSHWYNLSDPMLEEALSVRMDFMYFTGFSVDEEIPVNSSFCRFRNRLVELKLYEPLLNAINDQLQAKQLKVQQAQCAIVDATIIQSAARPNKVIEMPSAELCEEPAQPSDDGISISYSADEQARWTKKGKKCYFGYKAFVRIDGADGYIEKVKVTPANRSECPQFPELVEGCQAKRILADKGSASQHNRAFLKSRKLRDGIMHKAHKDQPLTFWQKCKNKLISRIRYKVERCFGTLKRQFGCHRARYCSTGKVEAQLHWSAMCYNLLKATHLLQTNKA